MRISIIIPAYNAAPFLARSVASVAGQQYGAHEIIIVDDGSTDETGSVADQLAAENLCVRVLYQENRGVSAARNAGLDAATGEYVLFLDADDVLQPGLFEDAFRGSSEPECILYGFDYIYADHTAQNLPSLSAGRHSREEILQAFWDLYRDGVLSNIGTKIYRRDILVEHEIRFNEQATILEDVTFYLNALQYTQEIMVLGKSYYGYYMDANAASIQKRFRPRYGEHLSRFFQSAMDLHAPVNKDLYLIYMDAMLLVLRNDLLDHDATRAEILQRYQSYMDYPLVRTSEQYYQW